MDNQTRSFTDHEGRPDGGHSFGPGYTIAWQRGPLVNEKGEHIERNGAFIEEIIQAAADRLAVMQQTQFACCENETALLCLRGARRALQCRQLRRAAEGTAGSHRGA